MIAMPDPSTFAVLPWRPGGQRAWRACSATWSRPAASPMRAIPGRCCGARSSGRSRWASTNFYVGPELEYFYFRNARPERGMPEVLDEGGYFDLTTLDAGSDVRRETVLALEELGIHVEYTHHEVGPSQHEIDMRYADALKMADDCMTYRITVKEYAMKYGWHATFMPKPLFGENGSGMHTHQSLFKDGEQRLLRPRRPVLPLRRRQGVHRRPAEARARDHLGVRPVGELLQAARAGLRGAGVLRVVAPQPLGAGAGAALPPRQGAGHAHGAALPGPGVQPLPDLRDPAGGRARGHREGLRAARADGEEPLPHVSPDDRRRLGIEQLPETLGEADRAHRRVRAGAPHLRRAHLQPLRGDQAAGVGGLPGPGLPVGAGPLPVSPRVRDGSGAPCCRRTRRSIDDDNDDGHQIRGPMSKTSAGTRIERTIRVSSRTPNATTNPSSVRNVSGSTASTRNVPASTTPAEVITPPVTARPRSCPRGPRSAPTPRAPGPSGRCCSRSPAPRGKRTRTAPGRACFPGTRRSRRTR